MWVGKMKSIVFMLTKAPSSESEGILKLAIEGLRNGNKVNIYLLSDAVLHAKQNQRVSEAIQEIIALGALVYAAREELLSRGLNENCLIKGVALPQDLIEAFVKDIMERADSVLSF